tara:strand:- start:4673 stop:6334 length:1662 start_codon:yes stop_codon:yes gene_type:complete
MREYEHYEAIVVGAGPGGAAAAAVLAENDIETIVLERGIEPGSKNVSGGLIYAEESSPYTIDNLFPEFRNEATERPITEYKLHNISGEKVASFDLKGLHEYDTKWCDSVLRRKMDSWLSKEVQSRTQETGGGLINGIHVNGLLRDENGKIEGVTCDEIDPITADVVIAADGVTSGLARASGLMDWERPEEWFQGVKVVVDLKEVDSIFDLEPETGIAHLFSGDLFEGVRGGGFLYTNRESLSIGTVFHLDSIMEEEAESHELLNKLLTHPLLGQWLDKDYCELEYSAKLVPDSKKAANPNPHLDRLLLVGDAAGQMQAQGPIIKGMNHAVTAGALAAEAFVEMNEKGDSGKAGERYELKLRQTGLMSKLRPPMYSVVKVVAENKVATAIVDGVLTSPVGRVAIRAMGKRIGKLYNVPILSMAIPDTSTPYVTLPTIIGQEVGEIIKSKNLVDPPELADRISKLAYDTDIGKPHIELIDNSYAASGGAVTACPVSAVGFGGGCYRVEEIEVDGTVELRVSLDTQPCIECGTCAVVAETEWSNPRGNKGVEFKYG